MENLNNSTIIKNISTNQHEILYNIMQLYNDGKPFECDITASQLKFYNSKEYPIPEPKYLFDVAPQSEKIQKLDPFGPIPLEDNSVDSIVIDLPFVVSPPEAPSAKEAKDGVNMIFSRFHGYYPVDNLYESYYHWIKEAFRVLKEDGICVFKCQDTVSGGIQHNVESFSFMAAERAGFTAEDKFILEAKSRLISPTKYKKQCHARKYTSLFWIFKKDFREKTTKFKCEEILDIMDKKPLAEVGEYYNFKERKRKK